MFPSSRTTLTALLAGLVFLAGQAHTQGPKKKDKVAERPDALEHLKKAEQSYNKAHAAVLKSVETAMAQSKAAVDKARKAWQTAKDAKARAQAQTDMRTANAELTRLRSAHSRVLQSRLYTPYVPPVRHEARLGARLDRPSQTLIAQLKLDQKIGLVVTYLDKKGPAAKAGVQPHDVLIQINGKKVSSDLLALRKALSAVKPEEKITATVLRAGKEETIKDLALPALKPRSKPVRVPLLSGETP